jgi:DNA-binding CsgD family transcriptional regulator
MTADLQSLPTEELRRQLSFYETKVNALRRVLRQRQPSGLTRNETAVVRAFVEAGSADLAAARLGMRRGTLQASVARACRKLHVDEAGLAAVVQALDGTA